VVNYIIRSQYLTGMNLFCFRSDNLSDWRGTAFPELLIVLSGILYLNLTNELLFLPLVIL